VGGGIDNEIPFGSRRQPGPINRVRSIPGKGAKNGRTAFVTSDGLVVWSRPSAGDDVRSFYPTSHPIAALHGIASVPWRGGHAGAAARIAMVWMVAEASAQARTIGGFSGNSPYPVRRRKGADRKCLVEFGKNLPATMRRIVGISGTGLGGCRHHVKQPRGTGPRRIDKSRVRTRIGCAAPLAQPGISSAENIRKHRRPRRRSAHSG